MAKYRRPQPGEPDHADPYFKKRVRKCGRPDCARAFETSAHWRYFCPRHRKGQEMKGPAPKRLA